MTAFSQPFARLGGGVEEGQLDPVPLALAPQQGHQAHVGVGLSDQCAHGGLPQGMHGSDGQDFPLQVAAEGEDIALVTAEQLHTDAPGGQDVGQRQICLGLINSPPGGGVHAVDLEADPVGTGQGGADVLAPDQGGVGDDGDGQAQSAQTIDGGPQVDVQGGLAVGNERQVVHRLAPSAHRLQAPGDLVPNLLRRVEGPGADLPGAGGTHLAIKARIAAMFGRDVVDPQTAAQTAGGDGAEGDVHA